MFNNHFILVKVVVYPKRILGILSTKQEYSQSMTKQHADIFTHPFTFRSNFSVASPPTGMFLRSGRKLENIDT